MRARRGLGEFHRRYTQAARRGGSESPSGGVESSTSDEPTSPFFHEIYEPMPPQGPGDGRSTGRARAL